MGFFSKGLKNEFEKAMVNEPSVFEPLKFYCSCFNSKGTTGEKKPFWTCMYSPVAGAYKPIGEIPFIRAG